MSYTPNPLDLTRRAATYIDEILKGARPADLPVKQASQFEFVLPSKLPRRSTLKLYRHYWQPSAR